MNVFSVSSATFYCFVESFSPEICTLDSKSLSDYSSSMSSKFPIPQAVFISTCSTFQSPLLKKTDFIGTPAHMYCYINNVFLIFALLMAFRMILQRLGSRNNTYTCESEVRKL